MQRKFRKNTQIMKKSIKTNREQHAELRKRFGVTTQMVWYSLNYVKNSPKAAEIRKAAIELGGVYSEEAFIPTCRIEETPDGFRQIFADEVILTINLKKSCAEISHHGEPVINVDKISMAGWGALSMQAQMLGQEGRFEIPV